MSKLRTLKIACGSAHSVALVVRTDEDSKGKESRRLFTWGCGADGRLGHGKSENVLAPKEVEALASFDVEDVACGYLHTAVISSGAVFTFGQNEFGQLGTGDIKSRDTPFNVKDKAMQNAATALHVHCGGFHTVCVTADYSLYSWGDNGSGIYLPVSFS